MQAQLNNSHGNATRHLQDECPVCFEEPQGGATVPLHAVNSPETPFHSVCIQCARDLLAATRERNLPCPICRTPVSPQTLRHNLNEAVAHHQATNRPQTRATPAQAELLQGNLSDINNMLGLISQINTLQARVSDPRSSASQRQAARTQLFQLATQLRQSSSDTLNRIQNYEHGNMND